MPTYAVLLQYEVVSGLIIEAADEDEAARLASEFEAAAHEQIADVANVRVSSRLWGDGTIEVEAAAGDDEAEDLLDEWIDELDDADDDDDSDEYESDDESYDDADANADSDEQDLDPDDDANGTASGDGDVDPVRA